MSKEKMLKQFYNSIYNKGNLLDLCIKYKTIRKAEKLFKNSYKRHDSFDAFMNSEMAELKEELSASNAIMYELKKQFNLKKELQACILTECNISQTIANKLGLNNFVDKDCNEVPQDIIQAIMRTDFENDFGSYRFLYFNDSHKVILFQCGSSSTIDAMFFKDKFGIKIEIKLDFARFGERDMCGYTEEGKLLYNDKFANAYPYYTTFIDYFNNHENAIEYEGNYPLDGILSHEAKKEVIDSIYSQKYVDLFLFDLIAEDKIYPIIASELNSCCRSDGSEIRITGKNPHSVFTPKYLESVLKSLNGVHIDESTIEFDYKDGSIFKDERYKLNKHFFLKVDDCKFIGNKVQCNPAKIRQLNPNISLHIRVSRDAESERRTKDYFDALDESK